MSECRPAETGSDHTDADDVNELRQRLKQAQAGERRAQALLESVASLMGLSDPVAVMRAVAENAVRHVGVTRACVYRVDHDAGVLIPTACMELDRQNGEVPLPGMAPIRQLEVEGEPIAMRPGNHLAEFAMGERPDMRTTGDRVGEPLDESLLVQMRTGRGTERRGALVGVIVASTREPPTTQQKTLLRSLASMGAATAEAARIEEFRSQLVSAVSHELRTPLAAIRAYNELLLDEDAGEINEEQRMFLERIEATCLHLDRMVEDLLDLSRLRAGEMVIRRQPVDVVGVIEHIIDTLSPEAAKREVELSDEIVGELPEISSNPDRLAQVLFNLVGNAVKYVDEGGCVLVRAGMSGTEAFEGLRALQERFDEQCNIEDGRSLVMQVIDDGPGIAEDEQQRIFDEFYRGRLTERTTKGSGLGLAIASRLTRLLGGLLEVDSTPGEGSTFWLIFPCEAPDNENTRQGGR